jgi:glycosyltransferase involved in cell wall biosynthesis
MGWRTRRKTGGKNIKVGLIQNTLAPYRIPLFEKISESPNIDFSLYLMSEDKPSYPQWKEYLSNVSFKVEIVPGIRIVLPSLSQICINPGLLTRLIKMRPDIVFCSGFSLSGIWAIIYKILCRKRMVIWSEETDITKDYRSFVGLRKVIRKMMVRFADGFVDAGQLSREYIQGLLPKNSKKAYYRSYNAVDSDKFYGVCKEITENPSEYDDFISRFPEKNILFSGRLVELKGIAPMIDIYEKVVHEMDTPVGLILLGQGDMLDYIIEQKEKRKLDNIFVEGFIMQDQYPKYFAIADLFLLLSQYDCNPLVIFEALSCGLPIIASDRVGNAPDFVNDNENGFVVKRDDHDDIARKIVHVLGEDNSRMSAASFRIGKKANYANSAKAFVNASYDMVLGGND